MVARPLHGLLRLALAALGNLTGGAGCNGGEAFLERIGEVPGALSHREPGRGQGRWVAWRIVIVMSTTITVLGSRAQRFQQRSVSRWGGRCSDNRAHENTGQPDDWRRANAWPRRRQVRWCDQDLGSRANIVEKPSFQDLRIARAISCWGVSSPSVENHSAWTEGRVSEISSRPFHLSARVEALPSQFEGGRRNLPTPTHTALRSGCGGEVAMTPSNGLTVDLCPAMK